MVRPAAPWTASRAPGQSAAQQQPLQTASRHSKTTATLSMQLDALRSLCPYGIPGKFLVGNGRVTPAV
jgi:hypothetical protein